MICDPLNIYCTVKQILGNRVKYSQTPLVWTLTGGGGGMESVPVDGVSILGGLDLEKIQGLRTRKTVRDNEVSY